MNLDYLKNATSPTTLATIALLVGFLVRMLKTKKVSEILDAVPAKWVKAIPGAYLPWVSVALGLAITMLDARLNGGLTNWREIFWVGVAGLLAGGGAVGGHETVAKLIGMFIYKPMGPLDPPPPSPPTEGEKVEKRMASKPPSGLSRYMLRGAFFLALLSAFLALPISGCAALGAALPGIIAAILDGSQVIDAIANFVAKWFLAHPDPVAQKKVDDAITKCRSALNIALRAAQGTEKLDNAKVDAAFDDFKKAYLELIGLVRPYGVQQVGELKAAPNADGGSLIVPEPLALKPVKR